MLLKFGRFLFLVPILMLHTSLSMAESSRPIQCRLLFAPDNNVNKAVRAFQNGKKDTTSLRKEMKFVLELNDLMGRIGKMQNIFGKRFKARDEAPEGYANITSTGYMTVAKYAQNFREFAAKIRFRKYFTRLLEDIHWQHLIVSPELKDISWLELKMQHPEEDNVVFKPRLKIADHDIQRLVTEDYVRHREGIKQRLMQLNPKKADDVQKFIDYFDALYSTASARVENMFARTEYERNSYSIKLNNPENPEEPIDIQITLDRNIRLTRLRDGKQYNAYKTTEGVIEVKIPLKYAGLTAADIAAVPELAIIKEFIDGLDGAHIITYPKNKGKMSKIDKKHHMQENPDADALDYD